MSQVGTPSEDAARDAGAAGARPALGVVLAPSGGRRDGEP